MVLPQLPVEVIHRILLYMLRSALKSLCDCDDESLRNLVLSIIYEKVHYGEGVIPEGMYDVRILELVELDKGTIQTPIKHFSINICYGYVSDECIDEFTSFLESRPNFLKGISRIDLEICFGDFEDYIQYLPMDNIEHLQLQYATNIPQEILPLNVKKLSLPLYDFPINTIYNFPRSLETLCLSHALGTAINMFPLWLHLLSITANEFRNDLPASLRNLEISDLRIVSSVEVPEGITSLKLTDCTIRCLSLFTNQLPSGLKCLSICGEIKKIGDIFFPPALEVVRLETSLPKKDITQKDIEGLFFPNQQLVLSNKILPSISLLDLPNLRILDIQNRGNSIGFKSLSQVVFPLTLEVLLTENHPVEDWSKTTLPDTLKSLSLTTLETAKQLKFPPFLETLVVNFSDPCHVHYSDLKLPKTLQDLILRKGNSTDFDWDLPFLRSMSLEHFYGSVVVPTTVVKLTLKFENEHFAKQLELPPHVEDLVLSHPLGVYPDSVSELAIHDYRDEPITFPPRLESLYIGYSPEALEVPLGKLLVLPDSLKSFMHMLEPGPKLPPNLR